MISNPVEHYIDVGEDRIQISFGQKLAQDPKAIIVFVFGIPRGKENNKSFEPFRGAANYLNEEYICATFSPAGMGKSTGDTTKLSLHSRSQELLAVIKYCRSKYPKLPLFLYGASMGAHLVLSVLNEVNPVGVILSSPAIYADRAEYSRFDGMDFSTTAKLTGDDDPQDFVVTQRLRKYPKPIMVVWVEKDRLSKGGPIWDVIFEAVNKAVLDRNNSEDKVLEIEGLEHGYRLNGIEPGKDNPAGIVGLKKTTIETNEFIESVMR